MEQGHGNAAEQYGKRWLLACRTPVVSDGICRKSKGDSCAKAFKTGVSRTACENPEPVQVTDAGRDVNGFIPGQSRGIEGFDGESECQSCYEKRD